ncbi:cytochrome oxidase small assembly protein [Hylemonella gracilis]|nr:cytochrome oxidase small assembly protein [Hylemonella gracilis]
MASTPEQKKANLRLGLILASVALVFFCGFVAKFVVFGR